MTHICINCLTPSVHLLNNPLEVSSVPRKGDFMLLPTIGGDEYSAKEFEVVKVLWVPEFEGEGLRAEVEIQLRPLRPYLRP